jgi:MFS family permease
VNIIRPSLTSAGSGTDPPFGWVIAAALSATTTVSYGVLTYAFAVLLVPMQRELGWSRPLLTGAFSLALLVSALAGMGVGWLLDRHSPRAVMMAGSIVGTLAVLAWSVVDTIAELYLVFTGIGLAMAAVLYEPAFTVITKWFTTRRHQALTLVTLVAASASLIFSPLTEWLVATAGWRSAVATLAVVLAVVTVPLHGLVLRPAPTDASNRHPAVSAPAARVVLRTGAFWLLTCSFMAAAFVTTAMAVHLVPLLVDAGRPPAFAALAAGVVGIAQLPGRLLFGLLGRKLAGPRLPLVVFGLGAMALALLALHQTPAGVLAFAVVYGMANGATILLRATLLADLYGPDHYGAITGVISAPVNTVRAASPFATAALALLPGRYTTVLWLLAIVNAAAALVGAVAGRKVQG